MYESHYVFQFARLWGAKEGALGISSDNVLLRNSQNPLDALLGDVVGKTGCPFFLIECKRERVIFSPSRITRIIDRFAAARCTA